MTHHTPISHLRYLLNALLAVSLLTTAARAQRHEVLSTEVASLEVVAGDDWTALPLLSLDGDEVLHVDFDVLSHQYRRLCYRIEHCDADWTPSTGLFESDYCRGFASGSTIDDTEESLNTNQLYTHYALQVPNDKCRLTMSGNYRLTVYDDNDADARPLLTVCFMVGEEQMSVGLDITANTDRGLYTHYQQVAMRVDYGQMRVTDPQTQVQTVVMQNGRWDTAVRGAQPQIVGPHGLAWSHCRALIFEAGNEYRKFETLDVTHTTMGLESVGWDGQCYHAYVWPDEPRPNYVYDEDADGAFLIRNSDNTDIAFTCEYVLVHFTLLSPHLPADIYIDGAWTLGLRTPRYQMQWNDTTQRYEAALWLKQGYYNYQYLAMTPDGQTMPVPSEGSYYQTENRYQALVYYRAPGDRTDRLVGYTTATYNVE